MASRRLAISSLLCADESDTPAAGPSSHPPPDSLNHALAPQTSPFGLTSTPLASSPSLSATSPLSEVAVPRSTPPVTHIGRRTPSPSSHFIRSSVAVSSATAIPRRSFKEIVLDNSTTQSPSAISLSANRLAVGTQDHPPLRQPHQHGHPGYPPPESHLGVHQYSEEEIRPRLVSEPQLVSLVSSPSRSPSISLTGSLRKNSQSPVTSRPTQHLDYPSSPQRVYRPSLSPTQTFHHPSHLASPSPIFASPSTSRPTPPQTPTYRSPTHSRHAISSLLTSSPSTSPPTARASAASLPHILNPPRLVKATSPNIGSPSGSTMSNMGMAGLEALVQAATQERRRLDEEMTEDVSQGNISHHDLLPHAQQVPLTVEPTPSSLLIEQTATSSARHSPTVGFGVRLPHEHRQGVPLSTQRAVTPTSTTKSSSERSIPSPVVSTSSPRSPASVALATDIVMDDTDTPPTQMKRRRSSELTIPPNLPGSAPSSTLLHTPLVEDVMPLIGPGVAPPLDRTQPSNRAADAMHMNPADQELTLAEPSNSTITHLASSPTAPGTVPLMSGSPEARTASIEATDTKTYASSATVTTTAVPETKPKTKRKRPEGKDSAKSRGKEKSVEKEKSVHHPLQTTRIRATDTSPNPLPLRDAQRRSKAREDDPDDWFREQFGELEDNSSNVPSVVVASAEAIRPGLTVAYQKKPSRASPSNPTTTPSKKTSQDYRDRSPTPLAMLEAELEGIAPTSARTPSPPPFVKLGSASPSSPRRSEPSLAMDVDLDIELARAVTGEAESDPIPKPKAKPRPKPRPKPKTKPKAPEMDVEDELLALLDDGDVEEKVTKARAHQVAPHTSSAQDNISTFGTSPHVPGSSEQRGRTKHSSKAHKPTASSSALGSPALDGLSAMPPPASRDVSQVRDSSISRGMKDDYDSSTAAPTPAIGSPVPTPASTPAPGATGKGKESSATAPKKKAAGKSRAKASVAKPKPTRPSVVKERSATPASSPHLTPNPNESAASTKSKKGAASLTAKRALSAATGGASRSRSTSAMPGEAESHVRKRSGQAQEEKEKEKEKEEEKEEEKDVDDRLYCVCRTSYDEDRVMIACDRCDEWYHTQCVNMPDLEVDLVDQFICPICVSNSPHLSLHTTYKKRCLAGLAHSRPASQHACHKPARGTFSKYCSDECGIRYMRERIEKHAKDTTKNVGKVTREAKEEGEYRGLWEAVKSARRRESVVVKVLDDSSDPPRTEIVTPRVPRTTRLLERLEAQIAKISRRRDELKGEEELVMWRATVIDHAAHRADRVGQCGWDGRLLWSDEEVESFGAEVIDLYDRAMKASEDEMAVDGEDAAGNADREWWCTGKKKCDRHAGWQKLRMAEVDLERELFDAELERLTTRERDLRRRIEDLSATQSESDMLQSGYSDASHAARTGPLPSSNDNASPTASTSSADGRDVDAVKINGVNGIDDTKKGKKRKMEAR